MKSESLTPSQILLTDEIANEKYVGFYAERKLSRLVIAAGSVLLLGSFGVIVALVHRPVQNRYIRIDEMGKATAIQYSDLAYSPREGEVRTYLTDWANYRYTINRETISKKYPMNYYFLSAQLANRYMADDNAMHLVSQVLANQIEQSDVEIDGVTITSMSQETVKDIVIARGTALVNITKIYSPRNSRQPRKEHWTLSVTYYLNPAQVSVAAQTYPQFETINPLGLTITEFHENRLSVEPINPSPSLQEGITPTGSIPAVSAGICIIEQPAELKVLHPNAVRWEAVEAIPGQVAITPSELLTAALRHRPDRIIMGEIRNECGYDLLQAMNTGHGGTLSTIHAKSAWDALNRLSNLALTARANLNHAFIRSETAEAIDFVLYCERDQTGRRRVRELVKVNGYNHADQSFHTEDIYRASAA